MILYVYFVYIVCISLSLYTCNYCICVGMCIMWSTLTAAQYLECSKQLPYPGLKFP